MTIKAVGGTDPVPLYLKPAYGKPGRPFLLANTDTANPVYYSDNLTISGNSSVIEPQATVGFDGTRDVYASTLNPSVEVLVDHIPGGTQWSNPVGVQIALNALGLAKDTSVMAVAGNTASALTAGVPPGVPAVASASKLFGSAAGSPYAMHTFAAAGRVWGVSISCAIATAAAYAGGPVSVYAQILTSSGITLEEIELAVSGAGQIDSDHGDLALNGLPIVAGATIQLDVNGAAPITNAIIRASGLVLYSVP